MNVLRTCAAACIAALALGSVSACGSDSDSKDAAPATLPNVSKADFVQRGNEICQATSAAIGSKFGAMSKPPKPAELTAAYDNMLKESYKLVGELLAVGAPKGQERELVDLLVQQYQVTSGVEEKGSDAFFADESSDPWAGIVTKFVDDFGLTGCKQE